MLFSTTANQHSTGNGKSSCMKYKDYQKNERGERKKVKQEISLCKQEKKWSKNEIPSNVFNTTANKTGRRDVYLFE